MSLRCEGFAHFLFITGTAEKKIQRKSNQLLRNCPPLKPERRSRNLLWSRNGGAELELLKALIGKDTDLVHVLSYAL